MTTSTPLEPTAVETLDVLVIGAGQAGLALGYHLTRDATATPDVRIIDAAPAIGHTWRSRWDSLRLFTPAQYDSLPGTPFPGRADTHPTKDQVADYLATYPHLHRLPVQLDTRVEELTRAGGVFTARTSRGTVRARQVVIATGPFQTPHTPALTAQLPTDVPQLHSAAYRNPAQIPSGARVLVVGAANSGLQIAAELSRTHQVTLAAGSQPPQLPQRVLGRDLFTWLDRIGFLTLPATSRLGRRIRARGDIVIGTRTRDLRQAGVDIRPRLTGFTGRTAQFADGTGTRADAVIWATGYRHDYSWLAIPDAVDNGRPRHHAGVTAVPGLYYLGLPWQTTRGSALLGFVARDAARIADHIADHTAGHAGTRSDTHSRAEDGRGHNAGITATTGGRS